MMTNDAEVAARLRRWAVEATKRLHDHVGAVLRGIDDPAADEAYAALVARLTAIAEQGGAIAGAGRK